MKDRKFIARKDNFDDYNKRSMELCSRCVARINYLVLSIRVRLITEYGVLFCLMTHDLNAVVKKVVFSSAYSTNNVIGAVPILRSRCIFIEYRNTRSCAAFLFRTRKKRKHKTKAERTFQDQSLSES
jgi:hypothetical protein